MQSDEVAENVEGAEQLLEQFNQQRDSTIDAAMNTVSEGEALLEELQYAMNAVYYYNFSMLQIGEGGGEE